MTVVYTNSFKNKKDKSIYETDANIKIINIMSKISNCAERRPRHRALFDRRTEGNKSNSQAANKATKLQKINKQLTPQIAKILAKKTQHIKNRGLGDVSKKSDPIDPQF